MNRYGHGLTLAELIVTVGILGGVVAALLAFFVQSMALNNVNRDMSLAVSHIQYVLEDIRSSSGVLVTQINNAVWDYDTDAEFSDRGLTRLKDETIQVQHDNADPLTITVKLDWQLNNGRWQELLFQTIDAGI